MWTGDHRRGADRRGLRYSSDLTDAEWELVRPFIRPAKRGGRPRSVDIREVMNAIFYVLSTGCQWNAIPVRSPAPQHRLGLPRSLGVGWHHRPSSRRALRGEPRTRRSRCQSDHGDPRCPERQGRRKRGRALGPSGFDAGKKVLGRKRHVLVDTQGGARQGPWPAKQVRVASGGLLLNVDVHAADIQDRDGAETLLRQARRRFPFVERIVADGGYAGPKMRALVARTGSWKLEIVNRSDVRAFVVLPKRWIVERTLAWISRNRRLARDYERQTQIADIFVKLAMIRIMLRRIAITRSA